MTGKRFYIISWQKISKYGVEIVRSTKVTVPKTDNFNKDSKNALDALLLEEGSLKKINVIKIQEVDVAGTPIGEPILPVEKTSLLPTQKI